MSFVFNNGEILCPADLQRSPVVLTAYPKYYRLKYDILKTYLPEAQVIAEIGARAGYSAWAFVHACPRAKYIGYDANNGTHGGQGGQDGSFAVWAKKLLEGYNVEYHEVDTQKVTELPGTDQFDFVHVDGDHTTAGVMHDLDLCFARLSDMPGAFMLVDDITYLKEVRAGVTQWLSGRSLQSMFIPSLRGEMLIWKTTTMCETTG